MTTTTHNPFTVTFNWKVASQNDGSLCFSRSVSGARKDMARYVRDWRNASTVRDTRTAIKHQVTATEWEFYELKRNGCTVGILRIERVAE